MKQDHVIRREDPQAVEKLQKKLEDCEKTQAYMKAVNAYTAFCGAPCFSSAIPKS